MSWLRVFLIACPVIVLAALLAAWAATGFDLFGLSLPGLLALVGGAVLTSAVAIGLMALVFLSNRSGHDEAAGRPDPTDGPDRL
ncbi:hypothetical protein TSH58p_29620 (plasmid) [Azospirillum sp. TSH58]|uniref:DUF4175 domain-containing protein n=1 Tax=Azospirillum brasilense TaxID=192 RepID=A0A6L3B1T2_AZOBR|nr:MULTISPECIES: hypothetical protein [Azospirillum]AWJ87530.1 hypothetical protein TSH58p_29620 [Azospirillum sp. TSH58]KAA0685736.1 hypothetical protein DS837_11805 [Azospirillum brasilense]PWC71590.1 hypothetical protein TSH58_10020 [Azospirillum sp. TSH58]